MCGLVVVPLLSVTLSRMPLQLYDLPFDMLEMIGEFYDDLAQREAASTLQAALKRHLLTRCDDPRHTARTNTPGEGPVLCYKSCYDPSRLSSPQKLPPVTHMGYTGASNTREK